VTLETKFEEFVALATGVVDRGVVFGDAVRDTDYSSWFIRSTHEWPLVATRCRIRVFRIDSRTIASDTIGRISTVRAVQCIEECIETTICKCFDEVVNLVEGDGLWLSGVSITTNKPS
jgi:hypothetical protein